MVIKVYLIAFLLTLLSSCATYNPSKLTPHFIDPDKMVTRQYHVIQSKPEIKFEFTKENTIQDAVKDNGGLLCLPVPQALEIKRKWESSVKSKTNSADLNYLETESLDKNQYPRSIQEELEIINGIPLLKD